ncbi:Na+/H+ antiporter subunit E [Psychromicrobium xiongbiense]|uniref:Na+/H+ antiporter subunit E n=1 Tax=Psychromicrobium xiongbiense TaxID=3051184 RepID=UPI0025529737|nr:Na+/H+ antiporter subunit E [Psychromicrobium sp. YIM S02556]
MTKAKHSLKQELPLLIWLVVVWAALWRDFSVGNLLLGALIAVGVTRMFYLPPVQLSGRFNLVYALAFAGIFLWKVAVASVVVAWTAITRGPHVVNAVVAVPLRSHSDLMITAVGHVTSLIPGSLVVDVDRMNSTLYLHALQVRTDAEAEAVRSEVRGVEAWLIRVMGTREELAQIRAEAALADHGRPISGGVNS